MQYGVSGTPGNNNFISTSYPRTTFSRTGGQQKSVDLRERYSNAGRQTEMWNRMKDMGYNPKEVYEAIGMAKAQAGAMQQQANQQGIADVFGGLQSLTESIPGIVDGIKGLFGK